MWDRSVEYMGVGLRHVRVPFGDGFYSFHLTKFTGAQRLQVRLYHIFMWSSQNNPRLMMATTKRGLVTISRYER